MTAAQLLSWWNLIYLLPFGLAVLYLLVYAVSGLTFGDVDLDADVHADADIDADAHVEVDAHADVHADVDADADVHADVDADADADVDGHAETNGHDVGKALGGHHADAAGSDRAHELPLYWHVLGWFGLGRVPLSIVAMVFCLAWGGIGLMVNILLEPVLPRPWMAVLASLPAAMVGTSVLTGTVVRLMERWMPTTETSAQPRAKLVGAHGEALYAIDENFGLASIRTREGDLYQVSCRVYEGREAVAKGKQVLLVDYDTRREFFYVTEYDLDKR